jgi:chromate transporter
LVEIEVRDDSALTAFLLQLVLISFLAIGGINAAVPELHRQVVEIHHWLSEQEFTDFFAIANAAPGPNLLIVTLIGYQLGGAFGAAAATAALCVPTCLFTYAVAQVWERFKDSPLRRAIQAGLVPITVGLIAATAYLIARVADQSAAAVAVSAATATIAYFTRINPLWAFAAAAALGYGGWV